MPLPNSLPYMESVDAKMIRAHEHLETLRREINEYLSSIKVEQVLKADPDQPHPWLVMWANDYVPPMRLSVLLGDCVHNMRSALDNLVCGLAKTVDRSFKCRGAFPFTESEDKWNQLLKEHDPLKGVPDKARAVIKAVQPWNDENPLRILNKLSNDDKHRTCNFTLAYNQNLVFRVHGNDGTIVDIEYIKPLYLGDPQLVILPMNPASVTPSARIQAKGKLVISLRDHEKWANLPIDYVLQRCFDHTEKEVISKFTSFFQPKQ